jgi:hypothetical protein
MAVWINPATTAMGSNAPSVKYLGRKKKPESESGISGIHEEETEKDTSSPVYPVWDVQPTVETQRREVVCGDGLCLSRPLEHEELRQDGYAL